jgi:beta-lactamase regulating signal transducer with metallopeptidase domain
MTLDWAALDSWPIRVAVIGGLVLLIGRLFLAVVRQPARRAWVGLMTVMAALAVIPASLLPGWVAVTVPTPQAPVVATREGPSHLTPQPPSLGGKGEPEVPAPGRVPNNSHHQSPPFPPREGGSALPASASLGATGSTGLDRRTIGEPQQTASPTDHEYRPYLLAAYGLIAAGLLGRLVLGHFALARLWQSARPAPDWLEAVFRSQAAGTAPTAMLRVSDTAPGPVCFGVLRPRVLVPRDLAQAGDTVELRCVLAHELGHLQRRDPLAGWVLGLARCVYFIWPWVGGLRRQVRLAQEYLADAAAVRVARSPADYAELLIRLTRPRPAPLGAAGVRGSTSDLYRRVTMLLNPSRRVEPRCPRRWAVAVGGGLTALAILAAGLTVRPEAAVAQEKDKPAAKAKPPAPPPPTDAGSIKALIEKLKRTGAGDPEIQKQIEELEKELQKKPKPEVPVRPVPPAPPVLPGFPGLIRPPIGDDPLDLDQLEKELVQQQEMLRKMLEGLVGQINGAAGNRGGVIVGGNLNVGPDGRVRVMRNNAVPGSGRLGAQVEKPTDALAAQLDLPNGQGLVCTNVPADSVAGKAGIRPHDILFEVNGKSVPNDVLQFIENLKDVKPDQAVDIVVLRKGKKETIKSVKLPASKVVVDDAFPAFPKGPFALDAIPVPALPNDLPAAPPAVGGVIGPGESLRVERVNDAFTVFYEKNGVKVTVTGSKEADGVKAEGIEVTDGSKTVKAESVDKLPKEYQALAEKALKSVK